tara:strand:- start:36 stop:332 length:297 start_codon:yes stop_codon:yes gene_type:complete
MKNRLLFKKIQSILKANKENNMQQVNDLQDIQNKITNIWSYTELEISDFSTSGLRKHLSAISDIVNDVLYDLEEFKACSMCHSEVCEECLEDMAQELG